MLKSYREVTRRRYLLAEATALAGLAAIVGTAAVGYGAYQGIASATSGGATTGGATPAVEPLPTAPSPDTSIADAQKQADDRRKTILQSGGQTVLTQQGMPGVGAGMGGKTLLGS